MFTTPEKFIDAVAAAKKSVIDTFVKNETVAKSLTSLVETEASIAKDVVKASTDAATAIGAEVTKTFQEAAKTDYSKQFQTWTQEWQKTFKAK